MLLFYVNPQLLIISPGTSEERSEDFMYFDASKWTTEENREAKELEKELINHNLLGNRTMFSGSIKEYPD